MDSRYNNIIDGLWIIIANYCHMLEIAINLPIHNIHMIHMIHMIHIIHIFIAHY